MTEEDFESHLPDIMADYVAEQIRVGNWSPADADALANAQRRQLLPHGFSTPGMHWYVAQTATNVPIGYLWLATEPTDASADGAWIYAIEIQPEFRGRGFGRRLLAAAEHEARRLGATAVALNVFGPNRVARRLYESSGYDVTSLQMRKPLN